MSGRTVFFLCVASMICVAGATLGAETQASLSGTVNNFWNILFSADSEQIKNLAVTHLWLALLICFLSGMLTSLTPCVYPMIPITISIFGRAAQQDPKRSSKAFNTQTFGLAGIYVAGMSATYSTMGIVAGLTGSLFGKVMQSPYMLGILILLFLALALSQLGLFKLALPSSWQTKLVTIGNSENRFGIFLMGLVSGLIVSPCVGPVIAGILAFVFESSNAFKGFLFFLSFSLGLGMLFLLIGGFSGVLNRLPRSGAWMTRINRVLASLMIIAAGYYTVLLLKQTGVVHKSARSTSRASAVTWQTNEARAYEMAREGKHPIVVDFTADWCTVCSEIDELIFRNPKVEEKLQHFVALKIDVSKETVENSQILKKYGVLSLPAIVFVDREGNILEKPRIHGLISAEEFLSTISPL